MPIPMANGGNASRNKSSVVVADRLPHGQGRTNSVVALPRIRLERSKVGEDAVAQEGGDMPAVLVDSVAHPLEVAIEDTRQDGRLQPLAQRGIADEIREESGHHLPLSSGRGARRRLLWGRSRCTTPAGASLVHAS